MYKKIAYSFLMLLILITPLKPLAYANTSNEKLNIENQPLYLKTAAVTGVPWTLLAACDHFEALMYQRRHDLHSDKNKTLGIQFTPEEWTGAVNPNQKDTDPLTIEFFNGAGRDGNGDGKADLQNNEDVLYTLATQLASEGNDPRSLKIGLWERYNRDQTVTLILELSKVYETFHTTQLKDHAFPMPSRWNYSYRSTWGARRGWGGLRIHEGTDIFAGYGTPVRATGYGIVETAGWNRFGGYRVGVRDADFIYHYYAHLSGFKKGLYKGEIVKPGEVIGYVGSTGYGPVGTQGKFPPHLHYGMYIDNGRIEYAVDPYPALRRYEHLKR